MADKKLIMLVEDEKDFGQEIVEMIQDKYDIVWAKNGLEALSLIKKNRSFLGASKIKCILLDLRMPEMDGQQFLTKFRQIEKRSPLSRATPIVFLTAYEDDEKWSNAIDGQVVKYLKKPVAKATLEGTLSVILEDNQDQVLADLTRQQGLKKREGYNQTTPTKKSVPVKTLFSKKKKTIMLVEDEKEFGQETIEMLKNITDAKGQQLYEPVWARNGEEAFHLLHQNRSFLGFADNKIKCILLDLRMPKMDGQQFLDRMRKIERRRVCGNLIPVIFLTSYEDKEKWEDARYNRICDYLIKPVSKIKLEDTLKKLFVDYGASIMASIFRKKIESRLLDMAAKKFDPEKEAAAIKERLELENYKERVEINLAKIKEREKRGK
jgi:CheY-like chemotaxis protein